MPADRPVGEEDKNAHSIIARQFLNYKIGYMPIKMGTHCLKVKTDFSGPELCLVPRSQKVNMVQNARVTTVY